MMGDENYKRFILIVFLFVISILLLVYGFNIFSLMLGWDGLGLVSFLLVVYYGNFRSLRSGLITIFINRLGDMGIIFSIYYFFRVGGFSLLNLYEFFGGVLIVSLFLACFRMRAQFPFNSWLPAAISAPTPVSSLVHSSTLVTAGVYLACRFFYLFSFFGFVFYFCIVSCFTMLIAGLVACLEVDLKKVIAISTLSQLGLMIFVLGVGYLRLSFFHLTCHALFKAMLFLSGGVFIAGVFGGQDSRLIGLRYYLTGLNFLFFVFSNFSLIGLFYFTGFFSKDSIIERFSMSGFNSFLQI